MKKMPLIRLEPSKKMVNCGFVARVLGYVNPRDAIIRYCKSMGVVIRAPLQLVAFKK